MQSGKIALCFVALFAVSFAYTLKDIEGRWVGSINWSTGNLADGTRVCSEQVRSQFAVLDVDADGVYSWHAWPEYTWMENGMELTLPELDFPVNQLVVQGSNIVYQNDEGTNVGCNYMRIVDDTLIATSFAMNANVCTEEITGAYCFEDGSEAVYTITVQRVEECEQCDCDSAPETEINFNFAGMIPK